jgi:hypothetical protein
MKEKVCRPELGETAMQLSVTQDKNMVLFLLSPGIRGAPIHHHC